MSHQKPLRPGTYIEYDHQHQILILGVVGDEGTPTRLTLTREAAIQTIQGILDTMGIGSDLLEIAVPPKEKQN